MKNHSLREKIFEKVLRFIFLNTFYSIILFLKIIYLFIYIFPLKCVTFLKGIFHFPEDTIDNIPLPLPLIVGDALRLVLSLRQN